MPLGWTALHYAAQRGHNETAMQVRSVTLLALLVQTNVQTRRAARTQGNGEAGYVRTSKQVTQFYWVY